MLKPDAPIVSLFDELRGRPIGASSGTRAEAEELTQETFLRLHQPLESRKSEDNPRGWLYPVAPNLALNRRLGKGRFEAITQAERDALVSAQGSRAGSRGSDAVIRADDAVSCRVRDADGY